MNSRSIDGFRNGAIGTIVLVVHAVGLSLLTGATPNATRNPDEPPIAASAFIIDDERLPPDTVPIADIALTNPGLHLESIELIQFESAEWGDISAVTAPGSAPQLSRFQPVDCAAFAKRAGLPRGLAASIVLTIEVLADGNVGVVEVTRSYGDPAVDAAAVAYARALKWIPGTRGHRAEVMRVNVPVILIWTV